MRSACDSRMVMCFLSVLLIVLGESVSAAMSSPNYGISADVIGAGGGSSSSGGFGLTDCIGQPSPPGKCESARYSVLSGYLYSATQWQSPSRVVETIHTQKATALIHNVPNPIHPQTTIHYVVGEPGRIKLQVFDVQGSLMRTLVDELLHPGQYAIDWDGRNEKGAPLASGVYMVRMTTSGGLHDSTRMIVIK